MQMKFQDILHIRKTFKILGHWECHVVRTASVHVDRVVLRVVLHRSTDSQLSNPWVRVGHCLSRTIGKRVVMCSATESPDDIMTHVPTRQPLELTDLFAPSGRPRPKRRALAGGRRRFSSARNGEISTSTRDLAVHRAVRVISHFLVDRYRYFWTARTR